MILLQVIKKTHKLLSTIHLTSDDILKIIKNPDPNKTHGNNGYLDDKNASIDKTFATEQKKRNVVLPHKKGYKKILKNYRPIILLPVVGILYDEHVSIVCRN